MAMIESCRVQWEDERTRLIQDAAAKADIYLDTLEKRIQIITSDITQWSFKEF